MWRYFKKNKLAGFTLVEVLVSLGIMMAMLGVVFAGQYTFTGNAALNNAADEIYLSLRQAQVYGTGVREFSPGTGNFSISYGLTFNRTNADNAKSFLTFADRNSNEMYDGTWACPIGGSSECLEKTSFTNGVYIYEICRVRENPNNPYQCGLGRADVVFTRPSSRAKVKFFNSQGNPMDEDPEFIGLRMGLMSADGLTRSVVIYYTGQISFQ